MRRHYKLVQVRAGELQEGDVVLCNIVGNVAEHAPEKGRSTWREVSGIVTHANGDVVVRLMGGGSTPLSKVTLVTVQDAIEPRASDG